MTQPRKRSGGSTNSGSRTRSSSAGTSSAGTPRRSADAGRLSPAQIARSAAEQLAEIAGLAPDSVSGLERSDNGWSVRVEVVEVARIPDSTSVMASYVVIVDDRGELQSYRREHRYYRNQAGEV